MTGRLGPSYHVLMATMSDSQWLLMAILGVLYVVLCVGVAIRMGKAGRSAVAWFFITVVFTAIPACLLVLRRTARRARDEADHIRQAPRRCRHCGGLLVEESPQGGGELCQHCGMTLETEHLA